MIHVSQNPGVAGGEEGMDDEWLSPAQHHCANIQEEGGRK